MGNRWAHFQNITLPEFEAEDVLVHLRLEFVSPMMGWPAKSALAAVIPKSTSCTWWHIPSWISKLFPRGWCKSTSTIYLLHQPYKPEHFEAWTPGNTNGHVHQTYTPDMQDHIDRLLGGYQKVLASLCDGCKVVAKTGS